jgi:hypothetical protein
MPDPEPSPDFNAEYTGLTNRELKALCDAMLPEEAAAQRSHDLKSPQGQRRPPLLKLVK